MEVDVAGAPETEADAYQFLERLRWGNDGPTSCPHCASTKGAWYLTPRDPEGRKSKGGSSARSNRRVWKCKESACRRQFSVLTNTVMHATKMPVRAWVGVVLELCSNPYGVSARDVNERWGVAEKSALSMLERIEEALANPQNDDMTLALNRPLWVEVLAADSPADSSEGRGSGPGLELATVDGHARIPVDPTRAAAPESPQDLTDSASDPAITSGSNAAAEVVVEPVVTTPTRPAETPAELPPNDRPAAAADSAVITPDAPVQPAESAQDRVPVEGGESASVRQDRVPVEGGESASVRQDRVPVERVKPVTSTGQHREAIAAADQVKSDVEQLLAEVFSQPPQQPPQTDSDRDRPSKGQPTPPPTKADSDAKSRQAEAGSGTKKRRDSDVAEGDSTKEKRRVQSKGQRQVAGQSEGDSTKEKRRVQSKGQRQVAGQSEGDSATGMRQKKVAGERDLGQTKRQKAAVEDRPTERDLTKSADPQPVDKKSKMRRKKRSKLRDKHRTDTVDEPPIASKKLGQKAAVETESDGLLGAGWLTEEPSTEMSDQDTLLAPAWTSSDSTSETPRTGETD